MATADSTLTGDSTSTTGLQYHTDVPDSLLRVGVYMFNYHRSSVKIDKIENPLLAPTGIEYSDPLDAINGAYYIGKGILGHPHTNIIISAADGLDQILQPDPNIGYTVRPWNVALYQTKSPYTLLSYNSSLNKDYLVRVGHTQNIMPGWNVSLNYRLIRPEGIYTSSGAKNHYVYTTTNYFSRDARLQGSAGIIWQKFMIDENGGITDDSYFTQRLQSNRAGVPVNLTGAGTIHNELGAFAHGSYNLVRQFEKERHRDSIVVHTEQDSIWLDTIEVTDTLRVRTPHVLNAGVFGFDINYDRRKRLFIDSTWWQEASASIFWTNDAYPDHRWRNPLKMTAGITPRRIVAVVEGDTSRMLSWLDPFAKATLRLDRWRVDVGGEMRGAMNSDGRPDSRFHAEATCFFDSAEATRLSLSAVSQRKSPDVRMIHDAQLHHGLALKAIETQRYGLLFQHRETVKLDLRANHYSHNTWYDTLLSVHQGSRPFWVYQAILTLHLKAGWLNIDMQHALQHSTDSIQMPVPMLASKNSLYADFTLFSRTIRAQVGVDIRYHTAYLAPSYDPSTGLFVHQDEVSIGNYLWADIFVNLNIKRASFYAKAGHINAIWETNPTYFTLPHYPGQRFGFFWGITWHFFD